MPPWPEQRSQRVALYFMTAPFSFLFPRSFELIMDTGLSPASWLPGCTTLWQPAARGIPYWQHPTIRYPVHLHWPTRFHPLTGLSLLTNIAQLPVTSVTSTISPLTKLWMSTMPSVYNFLQWPAPLIQISISTSLTNTAPSVTHFNFTDQHRSIWYPFQLHWPTQLHQISISTSLTNTAPSVTHFNFTDQHRSISYPFQLHWPTPFHQLPSFNFTDQRRSIGYPIHLRWLIALHQSPSSSLTKPSAILFSHTKTPLNLSPSSSLTKPSAILFSHTNTAQSVTQFITDQAISYTVLSHNTAQSVIQFITDQAINNTVLSHTNTAQSVTQFITDQAISCTVPTDQHHAVGRCTAPQRPKATSATSRAWCQTETINRDITMHSAASLCTALGQERHSTKFS